MKKLVSVILCLALATALLVGCSGGNAGSGSSDVIKIGIFEPLTGANAAGGELEVRGIELANEMFPEVLGKKVVLVKADNKSDTVEAATAAARLVESEKVDVVLGSWGSSLAMAGGDAFKNSETPAIGTSCTNKNVTLGNDYYFRVCFIDPFQGVIMANYATKNLNATKIGIIYEVSNDYAVGLRDAFVKALEKNGGEVVAEGMYNTGDQDFSSQLLTVMAQKPQAIFAPGNYTESALVMKQARELGYNDVVFLGGDTWETNPLIEVGGKFVEGCVFSTFFDESAKLNDMTAAFLEAYKAKYNESPAAVSALGFDAYLAAIKAIEAAGSTDGPAVREALAALSFDGCTGPIKFDENGDAEKSTAILKTVEDGAFTYLDTVTIG
ncbi:MAG: ABC transporter substrate-binding protein [Oscillospiraceae bacterium]